MLVCVSGSVLKCKKKFCELSAKFGRSARRRTRMLRAGREIRGARQQLPPQSFWRMGPVTAGQPKTIAAAPTMPLNRPRRLRLRAPGAHLGSRCADVSRAGTSASCGRGPIGLAGARGRAIAH